MRVSTSQIFDIGILGVQSNQSSLYKLQNQLSTGKRVLTPADDPVAAAQTLVVTQAKSVNSLYSENQGVARQQLSLTETVLNSVTSELQNVLECAVQGGNGSLTASDRAKIATELQSRLDNLVSLANSQDGTGEYLFSGYQSQVAPFATSGSIANPSPSYYDLNNGYVNYAGDDGVRKLQVDSSQDMAINEIGSDIFMRVRDDSGNLTGRSLFDAVQNMIVNLQTSPVDNVSYKQALGDLQSSLNTVLTVRSNVGAKLNALDSLNTTSTDLDVQYEQRLSDLQDLDYAKAISDMMKQKMQLEAAQTSFAQTSKLSLFNFI